MHWQTAFKYVHKDVIEDPSKVSLSLNFTRLTEWTTNATRVDKHSPLHDCMGSAPVQIIPKKKKNNNKGCARTWSDSSLAYLEFGDVEIPLCSGRVSAAVIDQDWTKCGKTADILAVEGIDGGHACLGSVECSIVSFVKNLYAVQSGPIASWHAVPAVAHMKSVAKLGGGGGRNSKSFNKTESYHSNEHFMQHFLKPIWVLTVKRSRLSFLFLTWHLCQGITVKLL